MSYVRRSGRLAGLPPSIGVMRNVQGVQRRNYRRRRPTVVSVVPRPLQGRYRYSRPDFEKKFKDTDIGTAIGAIAATFEKSNLNVVEQGDAENERVGRKITIRNIYVKGTLKLAGPTAAANATETVTLMILVDTQTNGAGFGATDFLEANEWNSYRNLANQTRFKVLWKKDFTLNASGGAASGAAYVLGANGRNFRKGKKCVIPIEYDNSATDGSIATQRVNSVWFCAIANTGALVTLDGTARIRYTDN